MRLGNSHCLAKNKVRSKEKREDWRVEQVLTLNRIVPKDAS